MEFIETNFINCQFDQVEKGSLIKACFESYQFVETNFNGFGKLPACQAIVIDSKFPKANKLIDLKGDFFLKLS